MIRRQRVKVWSKSSKYQFVGFEQTWLKVGCGHEADMNWIQICTEDMTAMAGTFLECAEIRAQKHRWRTWETGIASMTSISVKWGWRPWGGRVRPGRFFYLSALCRKWAGGEGWIEGEDMDMQRENDKKIHTWLHWLGKSNAWLESVTWFGRTRHRDHGMFRVWVEREVQWPCKSKNWLTWRSKKKMPEPKAPYNPYRIHDQICGNLARRSTLVAWPLPPFPQATASLDSAGQAALDSEHWPRVTYRLQPLGTYTKSTKRLSTHI